MQDLGNSCIQLVQNAGTVQHNPTDNYAKKDLTDNAKVVSEKVGLLFRISFIVCCINLLIVNRYVSGPVGFHSFTLCYSPF